MEVDRRVANRGGTNGALEGSATAADVITDKLYLPTDWELTGTNNGSSTVFENAGNQGRFAYYDGDLNKLKKSAQYFTGSPDQGHVANGYGGFKGVWTNGGIDNPPANDIRGCVPAFTVGPLLSGNVSIAYELNGGSGTKPATVTAAVNTSITLASSSGLTPKSNTIFDGWNTKPDGTGINYEGGSSYTPKYDITLYARWRVPTVTKTTPGEETWTVPVSAYYDINVWGAQGNNAAANGTGGKGGYSNGQRIALNAGDVLTLKIGAQGGGGAGGAKAADLNKAKGANGGAGGGLSSVRKGSETLIVAGGGGGAGGGFGTYNSAFSDTGEPYGGTAGGSGGGARGAPTNGATADRSEWTELVPGGGNINGGNGASGTKSYFGTNYIAGGGGGGGGAGYVNGNGGGGGTMFHGGGGGGGSGYAKTAAGGFENGAYGGIGVQAGNGKIVITQVF